VTSQAPSLLIPVPRGPLPVLPQSPHRRTVDLSIDGAGVAVPEGATLLEAVLGIHVPTLCYLETLTPISVCRICVVEVEGSRTLVPACSRKAEPGMVVRTDSERVRLSRRLILEFLASSVDVSTCPEILAYMETYEARPERFGSPALAATVAQPVKVDNPLYVRDYGKCILCYRCVEACGDDAQNSFAIAVAGRGFDARISTEFTVPLPESACVYCDNCIGVCPTGALMFQAEFELRQQGAWDESRQTVTDTICSYCGVGCSLTLRAQDNRIVRVTSPPGHPVTQGHLCIKGRFGWKFVETGTVAT